MTAKRTPEQTIHEGIVQLLRMTAKPGVIWYAVPNGEARSVQTGAKLKKQGVRPGVADLAFVLPGGRAAFLEIKSQTGRQSPLQKDFEAEVIANGSMYAIARGVTEAQTILRDWGAVR